MRNADLIQADIDGINAQFKKLKAPRLSAFAPSLSEAPERPLIEGISTPTEKVPGFLTDLLVATEG